MKELIYSLLIIVTISTNAQQQELKDKTLGEVLYLVNSQNPKYEKIEGSPYLKEQFSPCKINDSRETKFVRFNVVENKIEIRVDESKALKLSYSDSYRINLLDGSDNIYETKSYLNDKSDSEKTFFELIHESDKFRLYRKERIKYIYKLDTKRTGYEDEKSAKFLKVNDVYYVEDLIKPSKNIVAVPRKKKKIQSFFKEHSSSVEKFIKKGKLNPTQTKDLVKILDFYFDLDR